MGIGWVGTGNWEERRDGKLQSICKVNGKKCYLNNNFKKDDSEFQN